jgi:hypothetical protein
MGGMLIAQEVVQLRGKTGDGLPRHPSFKGIREDLSE